jgi:arylsulfatase A-like enzyme
VVDVPVTPDGAWRMLRVEQPVQLADVRAWNGEPVRVTGLRVGNGGRGPLVLETGPLRVVTRSERFLAATHGQGGIECAVVLRPALWLSAAGELARDWPTGDVARLRAGVGLAGPGEARWELLAEDEAGARRSLAEGEAAGGSGWQAVDVELPRDLRARRLVLRGEEIPPGSALALATPRLLPPGHRPRRVLLVLADTLRADALSCQGGPPAATPALDALAAQGARFASCWAQSHWTRPSIPSIFTGRYVAATGVNTLGQRLPAAHVTLAERFAAAGFHTAAFVGNSNAGPDAGLAQGFDELHLVMQREVVQDTARFLAETVEPRLRLLGDEDLFAYVHLMQAHGPYGPSEPLPGWAQPAGEAQAFREDLDPPWHDPPTGAGRRALYAHDVSALDAALGSFLAARLDAWERGPFAAPVVVGFMSDHGERLGEQGAWGHGWGPMGAEVLRVPLLLRAPGRIPPGRVCEAVVQNLDVGATLLELAGVPAGDARQGAGRSLLDRLDAAGGHALASAEMGAARVFTAIAAPGGLVGDGGRLVATFDPRGRLRPLAPPATLWDLSREVAPAFAAAWDGYLATQGVLADALRDPGPELSGHSPAALQELRALGYLGGR